MPNKKRMRKQKQAQSTHISFNSVASFWNSSPQKSICDFNTQKLVFVYNNTYEKLFSCTICNKPYTISKIEVTMDERNSGTNTDDLFTLRRVKCENCGEFELLSSFVERMGGRCADHVFKENPLLFK